MEDLVARIEALARTRGCAVAQLRLLDLGAGSGNYFSALRARRCNVRYCGLEYSQGMIDQFRQKVAGTEGSADGNATFVLKQCDLTKLPLPLERGNFDVVIATQVMHHLSIDSDGPNAHAAAYALIEEIGNRLLSEADGSFFWCQTQTRAQHSKDGFWWSVITPEASRKLGNRFPPMDAFVESLRNGGRFARVESHVPAGTLMCEDMYLDVEGPFSEKWRNCDSNWAMCSAEELETGLRKLRQMVDAGEIEAFMAAREEARARTGQTTTVVATKT